VIAIDHYHRKAGLAATALLKSHPGTASIPVIALTAMATREDQERSRAAGCDAYIFKPLRYRELYATIDQLLARRAISILATGHADE